MTYCPHLRLYPAKTPSPFFMSQPAVTSSSPSAMFARECWHTEMPTKLNDTNWCTTLKRNLQKCGRDIVEEIWECLSKESHGTRTRQGMSYCALADLRFRSETNIRPKLTNGWNLGLRSARNNIHEVFCSAFRVKTVHQRDLCMMFIGGVS